MLRRRSKSGPFSGGTTALVSFMSFPSSATPRVAIGARRADAAAPGVENGVLVPLAKESPVSDRPAAEEEAVANAESSPADTAARTGRYR
jgi:hypothetical protein